MSGTYTDRFCDKFHIGKVKRKPIRVAVDKLLGRAFNLADVPEKAEVVTELTKAYQAVHKPASGNKDRERTISAAASICDTQDPIVTRLEQSLPRNDGKIVTKTMSSEEKKLAAKHGQDLNTKLDKIAELIKGLNRPTDDLPEVMMPQALERAALQNMVETRRLEVNSVALTSEAAKKIANKIDTISGKVTEALSYIDKVHRRIAVLKETLLNDAETQMKTLGRTMKKPMESPLGRAMLQLRGVLMPEQNARVNPDGIDRAAQELRQELLLFKVNPQGYATTSSGDRDTETQYKHAQNLFDDYIAPKLQELRLLSPPPNDASYIALNQEAALAKTSLKLPDDPVKNPMTSGSLAGPLGQKLDTAIQKAKQDAETLRGDVKRMRQDLDKEIQKVAATKAMPVFALAWAQIDGAMESIARLMPPSSGSSPLTGETLEAMAAAKPLVQQVTKLVQDIQTQRTACADFDTRLTELDNKVKAAEKKGAPFQTYDPKALATIKNDAKKLRDGLPKALAADSNKKLLALAKDFEDKLKVATDIATYFTKTSKPLLDAVRYYVLQNTLAESGIGGDQTGTKVDPSEQTIAAKALQDELAKQPPNLAQVQTLTTNLQATLKDIKNTDDFIRIAGKSFETKDVEDKQKKKTDEEARVKLKERYRMLSNELVTAKLKVKQVGGDENATKAIEKLLQAADAQIGKKGDSPKVDAATATLDRIQSRINLVVRNPKGRAESKRAELPGLYDQWTRIRDTAGQNLAAVVKAIGELKDDPQWPKVDSFAKRIEEYAVMFTNGEDPLKGPITELCDDTTPKPGLLKARETALAMIAARRRVLQAHPLTKVLATSAMPTARAVPAQMYGGLDRLNFTVLTSIEGGANGS